MLLSFCWINPPFSFRRASHMHCPLILDWSSEDENRIGLFLDLQLVVTLVDLMNMRAHISHFLIWWWLWLISSPFFIFNGLKMIWISRIRTLSVYSSSWRWTCKALVESGLGQNFADLSSSFASSPFSPLTSPRPLFIVVGVVIHIRVVLPKYPYMGFK